MPSPLPWSWSKQVIRTKSSAATSRSDAPSPGLPGKRKRQHIASGGHGNHHRPDRLRLGPSVRTGDSRDRDRDIGRQSVPCAGRHGPRDRLADRLVRVQQNLRHTQLLNLDRVVVGHDAAGHPGGASRHIGQPAHEQAACARLSRGNPPALRQEVVPHDFLQRAAIHTEHVGRER